MYLYGQVFEFSGIEIVGMNTAASHCGILLDCEVLGMGFWVICIIQFIGSTA